MMKRHICVFLMILLLFTLLLVPKAVASEAAPISENVSSLGKYFLPDALVGTVAAQSSDVSFPVRVTHPTQACSAYSVDGAAVIVDGVEDSVWQNAHSYELGVLKKNYTGKDIANLADVNVKLLWDEKNTLYLLVKVKDSTPYTEQPDTSSWENDSFELYLSINGTVRSFRVGRDGTVSGWGSNDTMKWPWSAVATTNTEDGWIAEYKIALTYWQDAKQTQRPYSDKTMLIDFAYNDATPERDGRQANIAWGENVTAGDVTSLGKCVLLDAPVGTVTAQVSDVSLSVRDDLTLHYTVKVLDHSTTPLSMRFTMNGESVVVGDYNITDGNLIFTLDGIAPHQMNDAIKAELLANGNVIDLAESHSIKEVAQALLKEYYFDAELIRLVSDILYYGDAAQKYQDYAVTNLATSGIDGIADATTLVPSESDAQFLRGNENLNFHIDSATVLFDTASKLYFKIYAAPTFRGDLNIVLNETVYELNALEDLGDGYYGLQTEGIAARDYHKVYTLELRKDGRSAASLDYSVNAYAYSKIHDANTDEKTKALAYALYRYGVSAKNYEIAPNKVVLYSDFGAKGDGVTDDLAAMIAAHKYANLHGLPVKADSGKTFYIGTASEGAVIKTNTDFTGASFIIDDREVPYSERTVPIFTVAPDREAYRLDSLQTLAIGQTNIGMTLPEDSVLLIAEGGTKRYIRKGYDADNDGVDQNEIIVVDKNGNISADSPVIWDYTNITDVKVIPIDEKVLSIRGGTFTTIVSDYIEVSGYYKRGFCVNRSNVVIDGLTHYIENEGADGAPYQSFMDIRDCANVSVTNCVFTPHLVFYYEKNGVRYSLGTYDISPNRVVNLALRNCTQSISILDQRYWGIIGTNFCKNIVLDSCKLSRMDAHQGVHNVKILNSELGWLGVDITGSGEAYVEGCTLHGTTLLKLRDDYGSIWNGNITIKDTTWVPNRGKSLSEKYYCIIGGTNLQQHYFGYECYMPTMITIDNLYIDDTNATSAYKGIMLFADMNPSRTSESAESALPQEYHVTETVNISGLTIASGKELGVSTNTYMFKDVQINDTQTCLAYSVDGAAVNVDGVEDPVWQNAHSYELGALKRNYTGKDIANLADVNVKQLWDERNTLYLLVKVKDSTPYTGQPVTSSWENDSFELWLSINGIVRGVRVGRDGAVSGWGSNDTMRWPWSAVATTNTKDGWIGEYKIALTYWQNAEQTQRPSSDRTMLIDFVYNDATPEQGGRQANIGWSGNATTGDVMSLGKCVLLDAPVSEAAALGHTEVIDAAVSPSCTETGLTEGKHCSVCNAVLVAQEKVAALGHSYTSKITAPICTAQGYTTHTCSVCGNSYKDSYTSPNGHSYTYQISNAPATSATGTLTGTCSCCSSTTTVTLPKLSTTDYSYAVVKAATCAATGTGRYT